MYVIISEMKVEILGIYAALNKFFSKLVQSILLHDYVDIYCRKESISKLFVEEYVSQKISLSKNSLL